MKKLFLLITGIAVILAVIFFSLLIFPMEINSYFPFKNVSVVHETDGLKEEIVLFDNFKDEKFEQKNCVFPNIVAGEVYAYRYYNPAWCNNFSKNKYCRSESEGKYEFFILAIKNNSNEYGIKYSLNGNINYLNYSIENNDWDVDCENFVCSWFPYLGNNFSMRYKTKINYSYIADELKGVKTEVEPHNKYILFVKGKEDINNISCFKVIIYNRVHYGAERKCSNPLPFLFSNCTIKLKFGISKEIFWIDKERRVLVKMQRFEKDTIIKEVNLINITLITTNTTNF
ncbi:MAG: hypothetical protein BWK75_06115 [Candidatus Altiarchaeales archaeon A3]|nr:MAG: hypothetical protein BWK75_06115 [Candidatus Altiarchaeales archaeon A3]